MRRLWLVVAGLTILLAFLLVAVMACDGDGDGDGDGDEGEPKEQLQRMVLQLEDLPTGVIRAEEYFVTNEESAAASEDPAGRLAMLEEWGRILGYEVTYQANPEVMSQVGLMLATSTASLYASGEGASASFADAVETIRTTDWPTLFAGATEVEQEEIDTAPLTDEMLWLRITAKGELGAEAEEETLAQDFIIFRQGPARVALMVGWVMGRGNGELIEQLAEAQAQHLKDALS